MAQPIPFARASVYEPNLRLADLLIRSGSDAAEAERRRGDIAAQMWGGLGQTIAGIPQQINQAKAAEASRALGELQRRSLTNEVAAQERAASDVAAKDTAFKQPDRESILNTLPGHLRPEVMKQFADADAAALKVKESKQKIQEANNEYLAGLGHAVASHDYDIGAAGLALQHARNTFEQSGDADMVKQVDAIAQQIQSDPNNIKPIVDRVISLSPKFSELQQKTTSEAANLAERTARDTALTEQGKTTAAETARHNAEVEKIQRMTAGREAASAAETARHNKAMEGLRATEVSAMSDRRDNTRSDRSYSENIKQLDTMAKPISEQVERMGRLVESVNQKTPQADALVAPELLSVMAGGMGSGLRMNEAEISRLIGGRSKLESLKAAANKWSLDPSKALSITDAQREDIKKLIGAVRERTAQKATLINSARQSLIDTTDVAEQRKIVADLNVALQKINAGVVTVKRDANGKLVQ